MTDKWIKDCLESLISSPNVFSNFCKTQDHKKIDKFLYDIIGFWGTLGNEFEITMNSPYNSLVDKAIGYDSIKSFEDHCSVYHKETDIEKLKRFYRATNYLKNNSINFSKGIDGEMEEIRIRIGLSNYNINPYLCNYAPFDIPRLKISKASNNVEIITHYNEIFPKASELPQYEKNLKPSLFFDLLSRQFYDKKDIQKIGSSNQHPNLIGICKGNIRQGNKYFYVECLKLNTETFKDLHKLQWQKYFAKPSSDHSLDGRPDEPYNHFYSNFFYKEEKITNIFLNRDIKNIKFKPGYLKYNKDFSEYDKKQIISVLENGSFLTGSSSYQCETPVHAGSYFSCAYMTDDDGYIFGMYYPHIPAKAKLMQRRVLVPYGKLPKWMDTIQKHPPEYKVVHPIKNKLAKFETFSYLGKSSFLDDNNSIQTISREGLENLNNIIFKHIFGSSVRTKQEPFYKVLYRLLKYVKEYCYFNASREGNVMGSSVHTHYDVSSALFTNPQLFAKYISKDLWKEMKRVKFSFVHDKRNPAKRNAKEHCFFPMHLYNYPNHPIESMLTRYTNPSNDSTIIGANTSTHGCDYFNTSIMRARIGNTRHAGTSYMVNYNLKKVVSRLNVVVDKVHRRVEKNLRRAGYAKITPQYQNHCKLNYLGSFEVRNMRITSNYRLYMKTLIQYSLLLKSSITMKRYMNILNILSKIKI